VVFGICEHLKACNPDALVLSRLGEGGMIVQSAVSPCLVSGPSTAANRRSPMSGGEAPGNNIL
jgi:hypothetical protein